MTDFFKWFYTNQHGVEYMTLKECSVNDLFIIWGGFIQDIIILIIYAIIAISAYRLAMKYQKSTTRSFLIMLMLVFLFCSICGYGYTALSVFINPYKLRFIIKIFLIIFSFQLLLKMRKTRVIERIFEAEKNLKDSFQRAKEITLLFNQETVGTITIDDLRSLPSGVWHYLPNDPGVRFQKMEDSDPLWPTYLTEVDKDSSFGLHEHPKCIEDLYIKYGDLKDDYNNIHLKQGDHYQYLAGQKHKPYATTKSCYIVKFLPITPVL